MINERVAQLAKVQDGLITRRQALGAGMSPEAWRHATRKDGPWQRVLRGIYATFTGPVGDIHRLRSAILYAGSEARITGAWACWMNGLAYGPPRGATIVVQVPYASRRASAGFVALTRRSHDYERYHNWVDGVAGDDMARSIGMAYVAPDPLTGTARPGVIPMVPTERAVVDTVTKPRWLPADWLSTCVATGGCPQCGSGGVHGVSALRNVRALMCEAVQRKTCTVADLAREVAGAARNGTALARRVLADLEAGCRSAPECELRDLVGTSRILPEPRWNLPLPEARGIYPDACWPEARLVVEVDSRAFHGFGDAPERTERRRARYASLGWTVLPVAPRRIREEPARVLGEIEAAYVAGTSRERL